MQQRYAIAGDDISQTSKLEKKLKNFIFLVFNAAVQEQRYAKYRVIFDFILTYLQVLYFTLCSDVIFLLNF